MFVTSLETMSKDRLFEILLGDHMIDYRVGQLTWQLPGNHG